MEPVLEFTQLFRGEVLENRRLLEDEHRKTFWALPVSEDIFPQGVFQDLHRSTPRISYATTPVSCRRAISVWDIPSSVPRT